MRNRRARSAMNLTAGRGADCIVITAGTKSNEPIELAAELARDRARVVVVGSGWHGRAATQLISPKNLSFGSHALTARADTIPNMKRRESDYPIGYVRWTEKRNMEAFLRLVAEGKINTSLLTTHRFAVAPSN